MAVIRSRLSKLPEGKACIPTTQSHLCCPLWPEGFHKLPDRTGDRVERWGGAAVVVVVDAVPPWSPVRREAAVLEEGGGIEPLAIATLVFGTSRRPFSGTFLLAEGEGIEPSQE